MILIQIYNESDLLNEFLDLKKPPVPRDIDKRAKRGTLESIEVLYEGTEIVLNASRSGILPSQPAECKHYLGIPARVAKVFDHFSLKILTPEQIL